MMESNNQSAAPNELPQPVVENTQETDNRAAHQETKPAGSGNQMPTLGGQPNPVPTADPAASTASDPSKQAGSNQTSNLIADDADLIEKEWVDKAKVIVAQTKDDPNLQSKEINKVKADYLKKRYNKDLKLSDT